MRLVKLVTRHDRANDAKDRWMKHYCCGAAQRPEAMRTLGKLLRLGWYPEPDAVDRVLGRSWTWMNCYECSAEVAEVLEIGAYDETVRLCLSCAEQAVDLLRPKPCTVVRSEGARRSRTARSRGAGRTSKKGSR